MVLPAVLAAAVVPLGFALLRPCTASRLIRSLFLYSWPVLVVVFIQAGRETLFKYAPSSYRDRALAAPTRSEAIGVRVVWVIFDELSQSITFGKRPAGVALPNLDRLRDESFYATSARAPADSTEISMPSLILGEEVVSAIPEGPVSLRLLWRSSADAFEWSAASNVFDDARQLGFDTALGGGSTRTGAC